MRVAVIGGGIFGCTAAVALARTGAHVTLYERHPDLLMGAANANPGRIHRGYHYPRDPSAGGFSRHADRFDARFPTAVIRNNRHRYLIAADSRVDVEGYQKFCADTGLRWEPSTSPLVRADTVAATITTPETLLDVVKLRAVLRRELLGAVDILAGTHADPGDLSARYDMVVDATYGRYWPEPLRYEVCETVLIELGAHYQRHSFVVMDGDYCCIDPHRRGHILYDVVHSVHAVVSTPEDVPAHLEPLIDRGVVQTRHSRMDAMLQTARRYLLGIGMPLYHGSMFTVRAVAENPQDARPTLIRRDGNIIRVLAGKLCTAPWAAEQVTAAVREVVRA